MEKQDKYWALETDYKILLDNLDKKSKSYFDDLRSVGLLSLYERAYRAYYGGRISSGMNGGPLFEGSRLTPSGAQGEKTRLKANHYRNLLRHLHQLSTSQKPAVQARASNSDYDSQAQTILANGLLDYYWREKNLGNIIIDAAEIALSIYGESFIHEPWNQSGGQLYTVGMDGIPIYEGEQEYEILNPLEVIRDPNLKNDYQSDWVIIKLQENKWETIANFPSFEEEILKENQVDFNSDEFPVFQIRGGIDPDSTDLINKCILYHKKSKSCPDGRMVVYIKNAVLFDGPLPYKNIPIRKLSAEKLAGTIYSYTVAWDLLAVQDGIDELHTMLMSNNKTFGTQSIWIKDTDKLQVSSLGQGMKLFKSEEPPTPIQLVKSAPETYNYLDKLEHTGELLSGISSTVRGNPEANLKSGNALALVVSQSIQFASGLEESINRVVEDIGMDLFNNLKDFSKTPRVANIIGKSQRSFAKTFQASDLSEINRVIVEQVNPLSKTVAGRAEIANNMLQQGLIKSPEDYIMILSTGQLDPATESAQLEMLAIQAENEELREGRPVTVLITENHPLHIRHHLSVIQGPEEKKNPELVANTLAHVQEHLDKWRSMDPAIMVLLGMQPPPAPPMNPNMPPQQAGGPINPEQKQPNLPDLPPGSPPESQIAYDKMKLSS